MKILTAAIKLGGIGFAVLTKSIEMTIANVKNLIDAILASGKTIGSFFLMLTERRNGKRLKLMLGQQRKPFLSWEMESENPLIR